MSEHCPCSKRIFGGGRGFRGAPCSKKATVERDGKMFCTVHDPVRVKEKSHERIKKYNARFERQMKEARVRNAAPSMLERLRDVLTFIEDGIPIDDMNWSIAAEDIRAVISKATGETQ